MNLDTFRSQFFAGAPRYEWLEDLGRGGMGVVFKAKDRDLDEVVAIKVLYGHIGDGDDDGAILARFKREISLNRKVKHPNVARMYDFGSGGGHPYITMEFVPGQDLQSLILREGRIPPERAIRILRQICQGTQAAHEQGIVHRDLKSQNIIVGSGDVVSILDFGLARGAVDEKLTQEAVVLGTPHYISPEQAMGQSADVRSDLYSIGIIAFEMLSGVLPFTADSALGIAMKQISEPVPGNLSLYPEIPPRLREAVHRALAKRREDRPQTAAALDAAFARAAGLPDAPGADDEEIALARAIDAALGDPAGGAWPQRPVDSLRDGDPTPVVPHRPRPRPAPGAEPAPSPIRPSSGATTPPVTPTMRRAAGRPTVFVVMGDGADRISAGKAFVESGCDAVEARSGEEILELLMSRVPDAVVMDIALPKADGFEVARILKATPTFTQVPVLLLGTRVDRAQEHFARQVGASEVLSRPVSERELVERTWRLLATRGFYRDEAPSSRISRSTAPVPPGSDSTPS
ncbi:MAG TPA: serine/threonine-protein kinase [Thermoanaerobaculia bacterium]|jgi:serine/threonine protein kinase/CheY-like chemotaxis protein|nr:serine/threonine-protein kinase [Thermoanaerobaculia bacterium]HPA51656.1 serine/threonine-protein kinase [Thermoanaerobaculia bacterium]HQN07644.1 serine/threonine-protein kinase [Thermoanaerobaculia bacterium]HQP85380.1 serine/threonine-protein kinase [Thermoanaerobaculia bacterium]